MKRTLITTGKLLASSLVITMAFSSTAMAQAKSTSTTPQVDVDNAQPNAISYGSTRSNTRGIIASPAGETPDVVDAIKEQRDPSYGHTRSNRSSAIAAPAGCVTVDGAVDANCDGVDDAAQAAVRSRPYQQCISAGKSRRTCKHALHK